MAGPSDFLALGIHHLLFGYQVIILVRCVLSFFPSPSYTSRWVGVWNLVYAVTEPLLAPIRKVLSRYSGGRIDFSPMVLILLLSLAGRLIIGLLGSHP